MSFTDWYDRYKGPKELTRIGDGRWKCLLAGLCPVTRGYGDTPEAAIEDCRVTAKQRRDIFAAIERKEREAEAVPVPALELSEWER